MSRKRAERLPHVLTFSAIFKHNISYYKLFKNITCFCRPKPNCCASLVNIPSCILVGVEQSCLFGNVYNSGTL